MVNRAVAALRRASRITAGPLVVRAVAFGAGFAALFLSLPGPLRIPQFVVLAVVLSLISAVGTGTALVSLVEYLAVCVWFGTTTMYAYAIEPGQVLGIAAAIYLHHTSCALAAVLPVDGAVAPRVLRGWLLRTGGVLVVSLALGLGVFSLPSLIGHPTGWYVPLLGLLALLAAAFGIVRLTRRPR